MNIEKGSVGLSAEYRRAMRMLEAGNARDAYCLVKTNKPSPLHTYDNLVYFTVTASYLWKTHDCDKLRALWETSHAAMTSILTIYPELFIFLSKYYFCPCASAYSVGSEPRQRIMRCMWEHNNVKDIYAGCGLIVNVSKWFPHLAFDIMEHLVVLITDKDELTLGDAKSFMDTMAYAGERAHNAGAPIPDDMYIVFISMTFKSKIIAFKHATFYFDLCRGLRAFFHMSVIAGMFDEKEHSSDSYAYMSRVIKEAISDYRSLKKCDKRFKTNFRICTGCSMVGEGYLQCSRCRLAYYCTQECCNYFWPEHRTQCKSIARARKEQANQTK